MSDRNSLILPTVIVRGRVFDVPVEIVNSVAIMRSALEKSVRLQSHYAELLNMNDGGERLQFETAEAWVKRLIEIGEITLGTTP